MSRRDGPIVAWHEVPGTAPTPKNRPVGHGMIGRRPNPEMFHVERCAVFLRSANHSNHRINAHTGAFRPYPTGRLFGVALSRHFVPGYDRTGPSGTRGAKPFGAANRRNSIKPERG
jgi:hypothetical protein